VLKLDYEASCVKRVCSIQINLTRLYGTKTFTLLEFYKEDLLGGSRSMSLGQTRYCKFHTTICEDCKSLMSDVLLVLHSARRVTSHFESSLRDNCDAGGPFLR